MPSVKPSIPSEYGKLVTGDFSCMVLAQAMIAKP